jgi:DNA-binding transcriptional MocR family regulator
MTTSRVTITLPRDLHASAQQAAQSAGLPFSTVVAEALAAWTRGRLVDEWLAEHQTAYGAFDETELRALAEETGVPYVAPRASVETP